MKTQTGKERTGDRRAAGGPPLAAPKLQMSGPCRFTAVHGRRGEAAWCPLTGLPDRTELSGTACAIHPRPTASLQEKEPPLQEQGKAANAHFSPPSLFLSLPVSPHCLFSPSSSEWIQHLNQREVGVNHQSFRQAQMPTSPAEADPHGPSEAPDAKVRGGARVPR